MSGKIADHSGEVGNRYGKLVVLEVVKLDKFYHAICKCDCGLETNTRINRLKRGECKSCGCINKSRAIAQLTTHGKSRTPEYFCWQAMKSRCFNPKNKAYVHYGGRGITVSKEWMDFNNFIRDMGPRPDSSLSLERLDNSKGYSKDNCVWADSVTQTCNRRKTIFLTHNGETKPLTIWARELKLHRGTVYQRYRAGLSHEEILSPVTSDGRFKGNQQSCQA